MEPFEWIMAISAIAGLIGGGISLFKGSKETDKQAELAESSLDLNKDVSEKNFNLQKEQFEYQKQLNETVMNREDTAFQRQVADLKAAGFSPLMVAGGASASPLTSANAPQKDVSGINTAIGNLMGAYNDIFNRKMNKHQFLLNTAATSAQLYTQIAESKLNQKKIKLENDILDLDYKYYKNHPERNLGLTNVLVNLASRLIGGSNGSALDTTLPKISLPQLSQGSNDSANKLFDLLQPSNQEATKDSIKNTLRSILPASKTKEVTQEDIDKDLSNMNKSQKKRVDNAIASLGLQKDFEKNIKTVWDYTNAKDYYKDFDEFKAVILSKKPAQRAKYLNSMNIRYIERKAPAFGQ